ncbi:hypothetical protein DYB37_006440 [Aphanomyces astaci]|uniref:DUF8040 domain-containing protein n=1 Tax=Aphanomyces astaci TaxID=112090 RepID=A0A3R7B6M0_APHAT|nr:hypothetical protein DYB37_006440 [Aphanomyces astaci]
MLGDARYEQWFHDNLRCDQAVFRRLVDLLRQRLQLNERQSRHSFEKKVAVTLYFLGSEVRHRETAAAFGMAKSWCIKVVATVVDVYNDFRALLELWMVLSLTSNGPVSTMIFTIEAVTPLLMFKQ